MRVTAAVLTWALVFGCAPAELSNADRLAKADAWLRTSASDAGLRAEAWGLYKAVLDDGPTSAEGVRAHFGLGAIALLDLAQALDVLANAPQSADRTAELPPPARMVELVDAAVHALLEDGIIDHWSVVAAESDFRFTFAPGALVFEVGDRTIDLSGEWDLTEIRLLLGALQSLVASVEFVLAYDHVVESLLDIAMAEGELPDLPASPAGLPHWLSDALVAKGVATAPWLDAGWGRLRDPGILTDVRGRLSAGLRNVHEAFVYLAAETDDQDDDVSAQDSYLAGFLEQLLGDEGGVMASVPGVVQEGLPTETLIELTDRLQQSVADDDTAFVVPDEVWNQLVSPLLALISGYQGSSNPVGLRVPAVRLGRLFANPVLDLKDRAHGLLPWYCATAEECEVWGAARPGDFVSVSEQEDFVDANDNGRYDAGEPFTDGGVDGIIDADYNGVPDAVSPCSAPLAASCLDRPGTWDETIALRAGDAYLDAAFTPAILPPLAHPTPLGVTEPANGIVDPLYLFFGNPDVNGFLAPLTETSPGHFAVATTAAYTNPDLMRLSSSLIWLVQEISKMSEE